jgi:hypothetical protein
MLSPASVPPVCSLSVMSMRPPFNPNAWPVSMLEPK